MDQKYYIGVDIGGTKLAAALVDRRGNVLLRKKIPTPQKAKPDTIFSRLKKMLNELIADADIQDGQLNGIGVGVPGIIQPDQKTILITPNINLAQYPLAKKLSDLYNVKVALGNDVNLGVLGETWLGVGKGVKNVIGLFPGTGIGGGIIINGRLLLGAQGAAGEIGHMIIDQDSDKESAGIYGSLEALASRKAIERDIRDAIAAGEKSMILDLVDSNGGLIKSKMIAEALKVKDKVVTKVINDVCVTLGKSCISMRHVFNPDMIILGGGVIEACKDYMLPRIQRISKKDPFFAGIDNCKIVASKLGDDAVLLGGIFLVRQLLEDDMNSIQDLYPILKYKGDQSITADNKTIKKNVFIRADGKIKKIKNVEAFFEQGDHIIGVEFLEELTKKNPEALIIGSMDKDLHLSKEGQSYLEKEDIKLHILVPKEAIEVYNKLTKRKAIFIQNTANK